jgi:hypothetical protein
MVRIRFPPAAKTLWAGGGEMDIAGWFHGNEPAADSTTEALGPGSYRDDVDGGRAMRFAGCGR